ncbi:hypothetical protein [Devosia sp.]|uniref:hypothetical protein n=1 Tax=Devosia sp. TaxID=1871048 RepID=UPI00292DC4C4|nr:hypothetical protein [Devosia sp.]
MVDIHLEAIEHTHQLVGTNYASTGDIPKDHDIFYRCDECGDFVPSVPKRNLGCRCGNVFVDKDYWRLHIGDMSKMSVLRKNSTPRRTQSGGQRI